MTDTPDIIQFLGRLHPLVLHLPIGILMLGFLLEITSRFKASESIRSVMPIILFWGMISAILAAASGFILSWENGYEGAVLEQHKNLGIATALLTVVLFFLRKNRKIYLGLYTGLVLLMSWAGHNGGKITHGDDFLTAPFYEQEIETQLVGDIKQIPVYTSLISPILKTKCVSCHNAGKAKGKLILSDTTAIKKGGESGSLFENFTTAENLIIHRLLLPKDDKLHMPPKGKRQLEDIELQLIKWWVKAGLSFNKTVADLPEHVVVNAYLEKRFLNKASTLAAIKLNPLPKTKLQGFSSKGWMVKQLGEKENWLEARLINDRGLEKSNWKALQKIAEHISILDLGESSFDDRMASRIKAFPHIQKLFLDQTKITDQGIQSFGKMPHLTYLNLYGCKVSDSGLEGIRQFKNLNSLYLWKTEISPAAMVKFQAERPTLKIVGGQQQDTTFANARLRAPVIKADSFIFRNQIEVAIDARFPWAKIYYTLDGKIPDTTSTKYENPIQITKTTELKVKAFAKGWNASEVSENTFFESGINMTVSKLSPTPNPSYKANGKESLVDYKLGSSDFKDGQWLGWQGENVSVQFTMDTIQMVSSVFISCLQNNGAWIFNPKGVKVWTSVDGREYKNVANVSYPIPESLQLTELKKFKVDFEKTAAGFVKIEIQSMGRNPDWHPSPGQPSWIFIDEILID